MAEILNRGATIILPPGTPIHVGSDLSSNWYTPVGDIDTAISASLRRDQRYEIISRGVIKFPMEIDLTNLVATTVYRASTGGPPTATDYTTMTLPYGATINLPGNTQVMSDTVAQDAPVGIDGNPPAAEESSVLPYVIGGVVGLGVLYLVFKD